MYQNTVCGLLWIWGITPIFILKWSKKSDGQTNIEKIEHIILQNIILKSEQIYDVNTSLVSLNIHYGHYNVFRLDYKRC